MALETFTDTPYPGAPATPWTTLSAGIDAAVSTLSVVSAAAFPSGINTQFWICVAGLDVNGFPSVNPERMLVTGGQGSTSWTVQRGTSGNTPVTHASGAGVYGVETAAAFANNPGAMTTEGDLNTLDASLNVVRVPVGTFLTSAIAAATYLTTVLAAATYLTTGVAASTYVPVTRTVNGHALNANVTVSASDVSLGNVENAAASALYVPLTRTVNGHALSSNVSVTASDVGLGNVENAAASALYQPLDADLTAIAALSATGGWAKRTALNAWSISTPSASDVGLGSVENAAASGLYVPLTRTVNSKALSSDISLTASDVGALSSTLPGSDTQILFNDGGSLGALSTLAFHPADDATVLLRVGGATSFITGLNSGLQVLQNVASGQYFRNIYSQSSSTPTVDYAAVWGIDAYTEVGSSSTRPIFYLTALDVLADNVGTGDINFFGGGLIASENDVDDVAIEDMYGAKLWVLNYNTATIALARGVQAYVEQNNGTMDEVRVVDAELRNGGGSIPLAKGVAVRWTGANGYTTVHGLDIEDMSGLTATTKQAINYGAGKFIVDSDGAVTSMSTVAGSNLSGTNTGDQDLSSYVTATGSQALSNKTGLISQWTNDSNFTTLSAVAGVGYLTSVTAHNLLSASHGDTTAGSVARGDLVTGQGASAKWVRLAKGTANQVLAMDGTATDITWTTPSASAPADATYITQTANGSLSAEQALSSLSSGIMRVATTTGAITSLGEILPVANGGTGIAYFTAAGPTTARTYTFPDANATIARTDAANTFTGVQTMTSAALTTPAITTGAVITEAVGTSGLVITGATQTSSFPAMSVTQTWNASGTTFTATKVNVTNTASAAASLLQDWQVGGASKVAIRKDGMIVFGNYDIGLIGPNASQGFYQSSATGNWHCASTLEITARVTCRSTDTVSWTSDAAWANVDTFLGRGGAAATVQHGADVNGAAVSQIIQACNGITGTDKTGGNLTLASGKGTGAGAVSSLIFQTPAVLGSGTTAQTSTTRLTITEGSLTIADSTNVIVNATTGTKIGTATSQKLGFWNATPIIQPAAAGQATLTDSTGGVAASSLVDVTTAAVSDPTKVNANFASVNVLLLAMRTALVNSGMMKGAA